MILYVKDVKGLKLPEQAHPGEDAAYDIVATSGPNIVGTKIQRPMDGMDLWKRVVYVEYGTNLSIAPENETIDVPKIRDNNGEVEWSTIVKKWHTQVSSRSSISKNNLILANGVGIIDNGYRYEIMARFKYIFQPEDMFVIPEAGIQKVYGMINPDTIYSVGDKIMQIQAYPTIPIHFVLTSVLPESARGLGGFGSSGK